MLRRGLRRRRRRQEIEDVNPMEGAINIVDAMLVFACGLMLSLVIYWNVDIKNKELQPAKEQQEIEQNEISGSEKTADDLKNAPGKYKRMGSVYVDPDTGKMYMIEE
ncbi:MAG: DUF2149 domain-containing protein [Clostridiales Family XIII bacterium]|jgi:hypothetical protein|nr:DUF2149 domain-containing protein [Clostridiales Family XIII bacterium]